MFLGHGCRSKNMVSLYGVKLSSRSMEYNTNNGNYWFNVQNWNGGNNLGNNNLYYRNSSVNEGAPAYRVRAVDSINSVVVSMKCCTREDIETDFCPVV